MIEIALSATLPQHPMLMDVAQTAILLSMKGFFWLEKTSYAGNAGRIKAATDDLRKKSISLAQSHYGFLSYILAYAASGFDCDIHLMNTDGEVLSLGLHFDLRSMQDRTALLVTVINMYRLLLSLRDQLAALENLMPDNIWVLRPQHHTQVMHVPSKQGSGGRHP
ncbi:TPA: hypothetical protein ACH3X1_014819 [Trebouxia sp. C0004]